MKGRKRAPSSAACEGACPKLTRLSARAWGRQPECSVVLGKRCVQLAIHIYIYINMYIYYIYVSTHELRAGSYMLPRSNQSCVIDRAAGLRVRSPSINPPSQPANQPANPPSNQPTTNQPINQSNRLIKQPIEP